MSTDITHKEEEVGYMSCVVFVWVTLYIYYSDEYHLGTWKNEAVGTVGTHSRIIRSEELGNGREVGQKFCKNGI